MNDQSESRGHTVYNSQPANNNNNDWAGFSSTTIPRVESPQEVGKLFGIWIHPFTRLHKIPVFRKVWLYLVVMGAYAFAVTWVVDQESTAFAIMKDVGNAAFLGAVFGLLLVFRTNSAYERWWEGRRQWGHLVNETRNLALKVKAYSGAPARDKIRFGEQIVSFCYALKHHLRDTRPNKDLPGIEPINTIPANIHLPAFVSSKMVMTMEEWQQKGYLSEFKLMMVDNHFNAFMGVCGACERIKATPLPVSYRAFLRQGIALNLLILPWILVPMLGDLFSIPIILIASYFLLGLEIIAEDIEEPFGEGGDDLPLDTICGVIQKTVAEILAVSESRKKFTSTVNMPEMDPLKYTTTIKRDNHDPLKHTD